MAHTEKTLGSEEIFKGHVIRVTLDEVEQENGRHTHREVVWHNGGAAVIAINEKDEIYVVRQYRYPHGKELTEIPAGKLEQGEDPFAAAKRELAEEAGLVADTYLDMGYMIPTGGYCSEKIYLYAAKGLSHVPQNLDEGEFLDVRTLPMAHAVQMVLTGEIHDGKTCLAILKLAEMRRRGEF